ncbi:MAG: ABC transporter substrate-binding protein [Proteobacteria bacterium]|nr:ABC transporter substrate-binding protein [Pseudomonadota bacterium]
MNKSPIKYLNIWLLIISIFVIDVKAEDREITLGVIADLTGGSASAGLDCKTGFDVARKIWAPNDKRGEYKIKFHYGDTQGETKNAISEFKKMTESDKVSAVVITRSQYAMSVNPISKEKKIPILATAAHHEFLKQNPYAFRFIENTTIEGTNLANKMIASGHKRIAIVTAEDEFTISLTKEFVIAFNKLGGEVVYQNNVVGDSPDYQPIVNQMRLQKPDAVFVNVLIPQAASLFRRIREMGMKQTIYTHYWCAKDEVVKAANGTAEGVIFVEINLDRKKFREEYQKLIGERIPNAPAYCCYAALALILQTIEQIKQENFNDKFLLALSDQKQIELLDETISMVNREAQYEIVFKTVKQNKIMDL